MSALVPGSGVVVTGAARGIGKALAARLAAEGCRVVVADLDSDLLEDAAEEIGAYAVSGDAASAVGAAGLVAQAREHLGDIDAWYGNAGIDRGRGLEASDHAWVTSYEVNVLAHVRAARLLVPEWLERGAGRFVVTASAAGLLTRLSSPAYAASKHAAVAFAEWLSATYRHQGVVVQAVCADPAPGLRLAGADAIADAAWTAAQDDRFLVLPQPDVAAQYAARAADPDAWLRETNDELQRREAAG